MAFIVAVPDGRTRIKLCGLTRAEDVDVAVELGVDALGFNFYAASPRRLTIDDAARLVARVPSTIATVGLFVDASRAAVAAVLDAMPLTLLQFHGDERAEDCIAYGLPYLKAVRMKPGLDLLTYAAAHPEAVALLLDADSAGYGGSGKVFDWSLVPPRFNDTVRTFGQRPDAAPRVVLSGGLSTANVADAIARVRPYAVDTASGIESAKGIKDPDMMRAFVAAVRATDRKLL